MSKYWREWIQERFGDRSTMPRDEAIETFWAHIPKAKLEEFFELIEVEYGIEPGLLRPEDNLERLTAPIKTKNPLRWFLVEPRIEDASSELNYKLAKRAKRKGIRDRVPVSTVAEYVCVWSGIGT